MGPAGGAQQRLLTFFAIFFILAAYLIRQAEADKRWGRPMCLWSYWFQPHGTWHLLSSLAISLQLRCWRLPPPASAGTSGEWESVRRRGWLVVVGKAPTTAAADGKLSTLGA